jgi:hypothetical protein
MIRHITVFATAVALAACGHSNDAGADKSAANASQPKKKPAYCFFEDKEMKGWKASRGKDGNIVVKGKAYRDDSRYQAVLGPPEVSGTTASISPTIIQNTTGFGAADDWWDVTATIPNSAAIDMVDVTCGAKTIAELKVPPRR